MCFPWRFILIELAEWEQSALFMRTELMIVASMSVVTVKTGHAVIQQRTYQ
jgi:hypothetical protein